MNAPADPAPSAATTPRARPAPARPPARAPVRSYAAAHVVADPRADTTPDGPAAVDWDATLAFRHHLWSHGLGVAEAMDTAQRGAGLDWGAAAELIRRSAAEARAVGGLLACGAGTDQLPAARRLPGRRPRRVRGTARTRRGRRRPAGPDGLPPAGRGRHRPGGLPGVYGHLLRQAARPVILHWLGPMFDPALAGYWGSADPDAATETLLAIIAEHPGKVDGVKVSLLDAEPGGTRCAAGCPGRCAATPATTSTTRS